MAIYSDSMPSRDDLYMLFAACVLPIHAVAINGFLYEVPSLMLRMTYAEMAAALGYTLTFALLESLLIQLVVALLVVILPLPWLKGQSAVKGTVLLWTSLPLIIRLLSAPFDSWSLILAMSAGYLLLLCLLFVALDRLHGIVAVIRAVLERLTILAALFVIFDVLGVLVVIVRNV